MRSEGVPEKKGAKSGREEKEVSGDPNVRPSDRESILPLQYTKRGSRLIRCPDIYLLLLPPERLFHFHSPGEGANHFFFGLRRSAGKRSERGSGKRG